MSYDFTVVAMREVAVYEANITSNVSGVWHKSFEACGGLGHFADALASLKGSEAKALLGVMLDWIHTQGPAWVASFDAPNGWGTGAGAVEVLDQIYRALLENPDGRVAVSR